MFIMKHALMEDEPGAAGAGSETTYTVPDTYTFAQIDGKDVDPAVAEEVTKVAKESGLSQEHAQALMNYRLSQQPAAAAVPDEYKFAQVDGKDIEPELVSEVSTSAKELGLTQEQAQKFMERELKLLKESGDSNVEAVKAVQKEWRAEIAKDANIGGDKLNESLAISKRAVDKFFPGLAKEANQLPFLDHPEVVRGLFTIGKLISPDGELVTGGGNTTPVDPAKKMFPNMN